MQKISRSITLVGPFPPPYGGISIHLQRLTRYLDQSQYDYTLYNGTSDSSCSNRIISVKNRKLFFIVKLFLFERSKIFHLHTPNFLARVVFGIMAMFRSGKYVISIQGRSINLSIEKSLIKKWITFWILNQMDAIIACNENIKNDCINKIGLSKKKIFMIPAYIPPLVEDIKEPPAYLSKFIQSHFPVLCATGWIGQKYNAEDVYGIDMLIELTERLMPDFPNIGLVLSVNGAESEKLVQQTINHAKALVGDHINFIIEQLDDVVGLYRDCDLFCRPTNTDGDAVSIREALHVGTPVIASDCVTRPVECVLFKSRNMNDFEHTVRKALKRIDKLFVVPKVEGAPNNAELILQLYNTLIAGD